MSGKKELTFLLHPCPKPGNHLLAAHPVSFHLDLELFPDHPLKDRFHFLAVGIQPHSVHVVAGRQGVAEAEDSHWLFRGHGPCPEQALGVRRLGEAEGKRLLVCLRFVQ